MDYGFFQQIIHTGNMHNEREIPTGSDAWTLPASLFAQIDSIKVIWTIREI